MSGRPVQVSVIGAGVVGVSCALWLQHKGFTVTLVDGNEPGSGTSSGNACTIAHYGCIPINHPGLVTRLPRLAFGSHSPLRISPLYALTHLPWMLSFLRYCTPGKVAQTVDGLGALLGQCHAGLDPLVERTGARDLLRANGCLYGYTSEQSFKQAEKDNQTRRRQGATFTELSADDIHDLEPNLKPIFKKGLLFENTQSVINPQALVTRWFRHFLDGGGEYVPRHARRIGHLDQGIRVHLDDGGHFDTRRVVISSGAFSARIEGCGAARLPLDVERGYHVAYAGQQALVSRPVAWTEAGFYAVPTDEALRFAGTVEIAGLSEKKNRRRINYMARKSREMFHLPEAHTSDWLGFRPTLPDSLPVIGPAPHLPDTWYAFGHHHLGLTLAGITGRLIARMIAGEPPGLDVSPFSPARFGG